MIAGHDRRVISLSWTLPFSVVAIALLAAASCANPVDRSGEATATIANGPTAELTVTVVPFLPVYTPTPGSGNVQPDATNEPSAPAEIPEVYVVEEGDSLYAISARFGVELAALVEANNLSDPNDIRIGQELIIPRPGQ